MSAGLPTWMPPHLSCSSALDRVTGFIDLACLAPWMTKWLRRPEFAAETGPPPIAEKSSDMLVS